MYKVGITNVGEGIPINIEKLISTLNSIQRSFHFKIVPPFTMGIVGEPDIERLFYSTKKIFELLRTHRNYDNYDFLVGLTHLKIVEDIPLVGNEKLYFSLSDNNKLSIISLNEQITKYNPSSKNLYQYTVCLMACELLINLSKTNLMHLSPRYCLFDDCVDRNDFTKCINKGIICEECLAKLKKENVSQEILHDIERMTNWCKRNSIWYSIKKTIMNPIFTLVLGTVTGWLASMFVGIQYLIIFLCILALAFVFILAYYQFIFDKS